MSDDRDDRDDRDDLWDEFDALEAGGRDRGDAIDPAGDLDETAYDEADVDEADVDDAAYDEAELGDGDGDEETGSREPRRHPAIFAPNWRTVLIVDAGIGVVVLVIGLVLAIAWNPVVGGFIGSVGFVYVALVVRRGQDWARQRREAGLP